MKFDTPKEIYHSEIEKEKNYEAYMKSIYTHIADIYAFEHQLYRRIPLKILENVSRIYIGGNEEAFYNKSSYQMEDDDSLKKGAFYVFGKGADKLKLSGDAVVSEYLYDLYFKILKEPLMPSFISTEICYDLELGVRHKYSLYPENLGLHVIPSNTLTFRDDPSTGNIKNLPSDSNFIFHVDPDESAFYKKVPTLVSDKYTLKFHKIENGMCSYIYQFKIDDSTYNIKVWNLTSLFSLL